jgi:hypothetical protein
MRISSSVYLVVSFCVLFFWGCASYDTTGHSSGNVNIPTAQHPAEPYRIFRADYEATWRCTLRTITSRRGTVLSQDKTIGMITYYENPSSHGAGQAAKGEVDYKLINTGTVPFYITLYIQDLGEQARLYYTNWHNAKRYRDDQLQNRIFFNQVANSLVEHSKC